MVTDLTFSEDLTLKSIFLVFRLGVNLQKRLYKCGYFMF